jgi:hypothetical protein
MQIRIPFLRVLIVAFHGACLAQSMSINDLISMQKAHDFEEIDRQLLRTGTWQCDSTIELVAINVGRHTGYAVYSGIYHCLSLLSFLKTNKGIFVSKENAADLLDENSFSNQSRFCLVNNTTTDGLDFLMSFSRR